MSTLARLAREIDILRSASTASYAADKERHLVYFPSKPAMLLLQYVVAVWDDAFKIRLLFRSNAKGDNDIPPIASEGSLYGTLLSTTKTPPGTAAIISASSRFPAAVP
jgi:hypothetical protein